MTTGMKYGERGQVLLIVVLVMVVSLTIGLSVISRSITNVRTSTDEANSAEALAAAEAGIQQTLQSGASNTGSFSNNNTQFSTTVEDAVTTNIPLNNGSVVIKDEGIDLWLVPHDSDGNPDYSTPWGSNATVSLYWGEIDSGLPSSCDEYEAALEILVVSGTPNSNPASITAKRYAVDPCHLVDSTRTSNSFGDPSAVNGSFSAGGTQFRNRFDVTNITNGLVIRIIPVYFNTVIAAQPSGGSPPLPSQGSIIVSTGTAGDVKRKLNVFQGYSYLPIEFTSYGIFSPSDE